MKTLETRCCIVGGGPAGMMLGWLLARAGVDVIVLEKHADFFRDFRGDTIHPSTLELMHELGVLDKLLAIPHTEQQTIGFEILGEHVEGPDFTKLGMHANTMVLMPQWDFLDFVASEARRYPGFHLMMSTEATELLRDDEGVIGVIAGDLQIHADLVVACDGRHSTIVDAAKLTRIDLSVPIDVMWMRLPREPSDGAQLFGYIGDDKFLVMLNRGDYWQCAYLIEKDGLAARKQRGLPALRDDLRELAPFLGDRVETLRSWDDLKLLTVKVDRLERWSQPGLLCIGDAAHAMSPVGGVGINLAIQDAVAAANVLWQPLAIRSVTAADLEQVQARREMPTRRMQAIQVTIHNRVVAKVLAGRGQRTARVMRWTLRHVGALRRYAARVVGLGFRPEHVESPAR